jgi:hypothetical protein
MVCRIYKNTEKNNISLTNNYCVDVKIMNLHYTYTDTYSERHVTRYQLLFTQTAE